MRVYLWAVGGLLPEGHLAEVGDVPPVARSKRLTERRIIVKIWLTQLMDLHRLLRWLDSRLRPRCVSSSSLVELFPPQKLHFPSAIGAKAEPGITNESMNDKPAASPTDCQTY